MNESDLSKRIQTGALAHCCKLFRNNSGAIKYLRRQVRFGLGNVSKKLWDQWKTSDLIGYTVIAITPDMVGRQIAVFTAIEVKDVNAKKDARYKAQEKFIQQVKMDGGLASICNSVESLHKMFKCF